ncbi:MAG: sodium/proton-translocating pyrophosphatase [Clostridia bacterium]
MYISADFKSVKKIAEQSQTGSVTTISGPGVGMMSTLWPIICIVVGIFAAYETAGMYGIAFCCRYAVNYRNDSSCRLYGPVSDNAGGILKCQSFLKA